jgi:hypothetical protein
MTGESRTGEVAAKLAERPLADARGSVIAEQLHAILATFSVPCSVF